MDTQMSGNQTSKVPFNASAILEAQKKFEENSKKSKKVDFKMPPINLNSPIIEEEGKVSEAASTSGIDQVVDEKADQTILTTVDDPIESTLSDVLFPEVPLTTPIPECTTLDVKDLDRAVFILKRVFPRHIQRAIEAFAKITHVPEWKFLCGIIYAAHQNARFSSPVFDYSWDSQNPIIQYESICKGCNKLFEPIWRGQIYCTDECGRKHQGM